MTQQLICRFLGAFSISVDDQPLSQFRSDKGQALLAYLAMEAERPHSRSILASLLWPEVTDKQARQNLRTALHYLRQSLDAAMAQDSDDPLPSQQLLTVSHQEIQFNTDTELRPDTSIIVMIDVIDFRTLLAATDVHPHADLATCEPCLRQLDQAADLYRGEFLAGLGFGDAPDFEEWVLLQRETLQQQVLLTFERLAGAYESRGDYERAYSYAAHLLHLDSYRETAQRLVMRLLTLRGLPDQALAQYVKCRQILMEELGTEPEAETVALAEQIRRGELSRGAGEQRSRGAEEIGSQGERSPSPPPPISTAPMLSRHDWREMPAVGSFFGRDDEVAQLEQWLITDRCRLVAILGLGGIGKSSLVAQVVPAIADQFDLVIWRSLLNAPPLGELLKSILPVLSQQRLGTIPESVDQQLRLVFEYLEQERILLILDNLESILIADTAGHYRPGYEPYGQLLQEIANQQHQGQLLLTSRERPSGVKRLERDTSLVRSLRLRGLDEAAGHELLVSRGLSGTSADEAALTQRYSGNPLALKLVADTVQDLFLGDLGEFLAEETFIFDDVRLVLDQQFARLSALEQDILFWLAIERESISIPLLRENLLHPPPGRAFLEALNSLQRRSLIERQADGFALQNVITEYLTDRLVEKAVHELTHGELNLLHRHPLMKAQAKEYVRESQVRLILQPVAEQMVPHLAFDTLKVTLKHHLDQLREKGPTVPSYAGGNIFNLLVQLQSLEWQEVPLQLALADYDFSRMPLWQAHLRGKTLATVNFSEADLTHATFTQGFGLIEAIAISPDGQRLAAGGDGGDITIWQLSDFQPIMTLQGHSNIVTELAFSPDGFQVASASMDCTVRMWDLQSGQAIWAAQADQTDVLSVVFSPDGRFLASSGTSAFVYLWDSHSGKVICPLESSSKDDTRKVVFSADGKVLAGANLSGYIFLWDVAHLYEPNDHAVDVNTKFVRRTISAEENEGFFTLAFNSDSSLLAGGSLNGLITIWDAQTIEPVRTLRAHHAVIRVVKFSPDNTALVSGSYQTLRLWDVQRGVCDAVYSHNGDVWSATFSPDGQTLVTCGEHSIMRIWEALPTRRLELRKILQGHWPVIPAASFSPSDHLLAIGDSLGAIRLWDMSQTKPDCVRILHEHDWVEVLAFSPDGLYLASAGGIKDHAVRLWDMRSKQCLVVLTGHTHRVRALAFTSDGTMLASAGNDGNIRVWDIRDPKHSKLRYLLHEHTNAVPDLTFNRDGTQLVSASIDQTIRLWDITTGTQLHSLSGYPQNEIVQFSPGADMLACRAGPIGGIRLLDAAALPEEKELMTLLGHLNSPISISFSPDGNQLVSGGFDQSVRLWDMKAGKQIHVLEDHEGYIKVVRFSPDGQHFLSGSTDGTARLWDAETGKCVHIFKVAGPYEGLNITGVTGITEAQRAGLKTLGAVETIAP